MTKTTSSSCGCGKSADFDAQVAFENLAHKYRELAAITAEYMRTAHPDPAAGLGVAAAAPHVASRRLAGAVDRIVGGKPTKQFPECCLVGHRNPHTTFTWFCTGVLVHPRIVLTAGHCNVPPPGETAPKITAVALNVASEDALAGGELVGVRRKYTHPGYLESGEVHDITVLILNQDATTAPVALATAAELAAAPDVTLVGFGNSDVNSSIGFGLKREVSVTFDALRRAATDDLQADELKYGFDSNIEFVAGGGGRDSCNGDSGGPAYIVAGVRKVGGLTSRGAANAVHACGESGIYTRVDANLAFIREVAAKNGITLS